jgi:hypothetical protein
MFIAHQLALFTCISVLVSCIYIPTAEHGLMSGRAMIRDSDIQGLEPGKTTRADLLLKFGDPRERLDDDEFFCYEWERVQGVVGGMYWSADMGKQHFFCAQFSADNVLLRKGHIEAFMLGNAQEKKDETLSEWGKDTHYGAD